MGRKKLQMKRIADKNRRLVTFSKRRSGLLKRARDLSVLCDVQVAAVVFSGRGKLYDFSSGTNCRYLDGPNAEEVSVTDLIQLEEQLDAALTQTRSRKRQLMMENILTFHEKVFNCLLIETSTLLLEVRKLRDENELLMQERDIGALLSQSDCDDRVVQGARENGDDRRLLLFVSRLKCLLVNVREA
ncbi:hypothetical protein RJ640_030868 [Escallonia rubra]|uniref:MADS-box domain-containing protein n=1 Tax=Escallonia rubra TaxID=112253 RepID=A0AA88QJ36_9ASTE|nr:hypothetical protein RJ640_030868 [Escallonia rubra]